MGLPEDPLKRGKKKIIPPSKIKGIRRFFQYGNILHGPELPDAQQTVNFVDNVPDTDFFMSSWLVIIRTVNWQTLYTICLIRVTLNSLLKASRHWVHLLLICNPLWTFYTAQKHMCDRVLSEDSWGIFPSRNKNYRCIRYSVLASFLSLMAYQFSWVI